MSTTTVFKAPILTLSAALSLAMLSANPAHADFLDDAKGKFSTSNIYFNRDVREGGADRKEWGQGFSLDWRSGFTQGPIGFGIDANAVLGVKLDSSPSRTGTGLLRQQDGRAVDEFSRIHVTGKAKFSATELRFGAHIPKLPVVSASTSRLLPQVFEGTLLQSKEISGLTLTAARFSRVIQRDAVSTEDMALNSSNSRYPRNCEADHLTLIGADWSFAPKQTLRYWAADVEDIYRQHFLGFNGSLPLGFLGSLSADVRVSSSKDSGKALAGEVDNRAIGGLFSYKIGAQKFGLGWQKMNGKTGFTHLSGTDPYLINFVQIGNFGEAGERSWQARYDLDFADLYVPGLSFMARYIQGDKARIPSRFATYGTESESERDLELKYVVQDGLLKDLSVRVRNARYRSDFSRDADEIRVVIDYSIPF